MTAAPGAGEAATGAGNGAEKKKFFPKKFGGVGMYLNNNECLKIYVQFEYCWGTNVGSWLCELTMALHIVGLTQ